MASEMDASVARAPPNFMNLPAEIREYIYFHIFNYPRVSYQISAGKVTMDAEAKRDLQSLRTCKKFYEEALPVLHGMNDLSINYVDIAALRRLPTPSRLLIGKVIIKCMQHASAEHPMECEEIDFGLIAQACPGMQYLEIVTFHPGSLLWTTQKLMKSLPCSVIRKWPLLQIYVDVPLDAEAHTNGNFSKSDQVAYVMGASVLQKGQAMHGGGASNLSETKASSAFSLGHEMPADLRSIRVRGQLSGVLCRRLEGYVGSFGDCAFKKDILTDSGRVMTEGKQDEEETIYAKQLRYTWHRRGEVIPWPEEDKAKVISGMSRWVPKLSTGWYESMLDDGLQVEEEKLFRPFVAARLPVMRPDYE